jgi:hypothetical protein
MCKPAIIIVLWTAAQLVAVPAATAAEPPAASSPAFTETEQKAFDTMYGARIKQATTRVRRAALAKELYGGLGGVKGGLKYLLLHNTKNLAIKGGDLGLGVEALGKLIAMKRGDLTAPLTELLDLQIRRFAELQRMAKTSPDAKAIAKKRHALGTEAVDVAIELANIHRAAGRFKKAEWPESRVMSIAALISSPKRTRLRQGVAMSRALNRLTRQADLYKKQGKLNHAVWAWLDAGMYARAHAVKVSEPDATAVLVLRAALDETATPADILAAAQAWDKRSAIQRGALEQLRLTRAAELYRRYLKVGEKLGLQVAKVRLTAIAEKLGDLLSAQHKSGELVHLVDVKEVSARVGWGSFGKITVARGPLGIAGRKFLTGLSVHAGSRVVYSLKGQYKLLSVYYGLKTGAGGAATFHVICDGKEVFKSGHLYSNSKGGVNKPLQVRIVGVDKLELVTKGVRGGAGAFSCWGDPTVR